MSEYHQNIVRIRAICNALEELASEVVFVGGATVSLYADRPVTEIRPTDDVDILIELSNYHGYAKIEEKLRSKGFANDVASGVICRFIVNGIVVDVMPTSTEVLGFSNRWYPEAYNTAVKIYIDSDDAVSILRADYFIATKLEAFKNRGKGDGRTSSDFEDIVFVLNNRTTIWNELNEAPQALKLYIQTEFKALFGNDYIYEWISSHIERSEQRRVNFIIGALGDFVGH